MVGVGGNFLLMILIFLVEKEVSWLVEREVR